MFCIYMTRTHFNNNLAFVYTFRIITAALIGDTCIAQVVKDFILLIHTRSW